MAKAKAKSKAKQGWPKKTPKERKQCMTTIHACGARLMRWEQVAAMLGVSRNTLWEWRRTDPKIDSMYELGKSELAEKLFERLEEKALAGGLVQMRDGTVISGEEGNTQALLHLSKRALDLGDKQTNVNVTPGDFDVDDNEKPDKQARRDEALDILGLSALSPRKPAPKD